MRYRFVFIFKATISSQFSRSPGFLSPRPYTSMCLPFRLILLPSRWMKSISPKLCTSVKSYTAAHSRKQTSSLLKFNWCTNLYAVSTQQINVQAFYETMSPVLLDINTALPVTYGSFKGHVQYTFLTKFLNILFLSLACYFNRPFYPPGWRHPNNNRLNSLNYILVFILFSPTFCHFLPLLTTYWTQRHFHKH